jgi:anti-sigma28 factor (negative regulator of flagellin synthesis)
MVDTVQNLVGTTSSVVVPESSSAPQVSTSGAGPAVTVGPTAPVSATAESEGKNVSVDVKSVMGEVVAAMQKAPAPINMEAVTRLKAEIASNSYPVDYDKITDAMMSSLNEIV